MNVVSSLINAGTGYALSPSIRRGVKLSNAIALILFFLSLITGFFYFIWYSWNIVTLAIPLLGIAALLTVFLNSIGQIHLSSSHNQWSSSTAATNNRPAKGPHARNRDKRNKDTPT